MGAEVRGVPEEASLESRGIGRYLAGQRKLRGISLDELAGLTRIPIRSLERLESGAFDLSPDGFVRGFVRVVAEALGLDPDEAVMRLMREPQDEGIQEPRGPFAQKALLARVGAVAGVALLGLALWMLVSALLEPVPEPEAPEVILRRDPVRALAGEETASPP